MTDTTPVDEPQADYKPNAPRVLRAIIYYIGIVLAVFAIVAVGVTAIFFDQDLAIKTAALAGVINSAWLYVSNQFAVSYLPPKVS